MSGESIPTAALWDAFVNLAEDARDLYVPRVTCDVLDGPPDPLVFHREYVAANRPCIIRNALAHWPALARWRNTEYLRGLVGAREVSVEVTPDGRADALVDTSAPTPLFTASSVLLRGRVFALPHTQRMPFGEYLDGVAAPPATRGGCVRYVSHQDGSLTDPGEFSGALLPDIEPQLSFAAEAFGSEPDAINFWMGPDDAVTSLHKDHYENIYCVVNGTKTFTLFPPSDLPFLYEQDYPCGQYRQDADGSFHLDPLEHRDGEPDLTTRPWLSVDPDAPDLQSFPEFAHAAALKVTVHAGEVLYLPSLWFHHVRQSAPPGQQTIAVNMWYDMRYDGRYAQHCFLSRLAKLAPPRQPRAGRGGDGK